MMNRVRFHTWCILPVFTLVLLGSHLATDAADKASVSARRELLSKRLRNGKTPRARIDAARQLHPVAVNVEPAVAALAKVLTTKGLKTGDYVEALKVIALFGAEAKSAVPALMARLSDPEPKIRIHCVMALQAIGPEAKAAVPVLIKRLDDFDTMEKIHIVPPLMLRSKGVSEPVRAYAMRALAAMGLEARVVIPKLKEAVQKFENPFVAAECLVKLSPSEGETILIGLLFDKSENEDIIAIDGLKDLRTPKTFAALEKIVDNPKSSLAGDALALLKKFGRRGAPHFVLALKNPYETSGALSCGFAFRTPIRVLATRALAEAGPAGYTALIRGLKNNGDNELRVRAAECLIEIGPYENDVVPTLVDILKLPKDATILENSFADVVEKTTVKTIALKTLAKIGPQAKSALPVVRLLLQQKKLRLRAACAIDAIVPGEAAAAKILKPAALALSKSMKQDENAFPGGQVDYGAQFVALGTPSVPILVKLLKHKDESKAAIALAALGKLAERSEAARNTIIAKAETAIRLRSQENGALMEAVSRLPSQAGVRLLERLIAATKRGNYSSQAESTLRSLGPNGVRIIRRLCKHKNEQVVGVASSALSLWDMSFVSSPIHRTALIRELFGLLNDPGVPVWFKGEGVAFLAKLRPDPKIAVPAIVRTIETIRKDAKLYLSESTARALIPFGAEAKQAVPLLIKMFDEGDQEPAVIESLAAIGPAAKSSVPKLIATFRPGGKATRTQPDNALAAIKVGVPQHLRGFLKHDLIEMRLRAAQILGRIGPAAAPAAAELRNGAKSDPRAGGRAAAVKALGRIGASDPSVKQSVDTLRAALADDSLAVRVAAATALGRLGVAAKPARAQLIQSGQSEFATLRNASKRAIAAIDAGSR